MADSKNNNGGRYSKSPAHDLQPIDHFKPPTPNHYLGGEDLMKDPPPRFNEITRQLDDNSYLVKNKSEHFIRDLNDVQHQDPQAKSRPVVVNNSNVLNNPTSPRNVVFSGSTTNVNPFNDPSMQRIIDYGMSDVMESKYNTYGEFKPPLSTIAPFTRMIDPKHQNHHQIVNLTTFNRFHLPIADLEHRKAFRHLFFTRPECYLMCIDNGAIKLCQQAEYDEDFNTSYSRMPYITRLLSPVYVSGTFGMGGISNDNFNYLLSNRASGLSVSGATLSTQDGVGKSIQGYTVIPGMHYEGRQGATISISFRDTKYLEVYEYIRLWMLYIYKVKTGIFAPSFNGYKYTNGFPSPGNIIAHAHPFDRALDYTCSLFDYVLDETGNFPRYWCKYFGMYPIDVQIDGLNNSNNDALKEEMTVNVTFKYAYKIENTTKTLIEFNYNAGICDNLGQPKSGVVDTLKVSDSFSYIDRKNSQIINQHIGPGAGFVGTPYIVLMNVNKDVMDNMSSHTTVSPCLRFSPVSTKPNLDHFINMGMASVFYNNNAVAQSDVTAAKEAAVAIAKKVEEEESLNALEKFADWADKKSDNMINNITTYDDHNTSIGGAIIDLGFIGDGVEHLVNGADNILDKHAETVKQGYTDWADDFKKWEIW